MYELVSFVSRGKIRRKVLKNLLVPHTPTELSHIINTDRSTTSRSILDLQRKGLVECITPNLRDKICPSKPLKEIEDMFNICDKLKLKKTMTLIIGLGEKITDFKYLKDFILLLQ